jgi:hypothetical protein
MYCIYFVFYCREWGGGLVSVLSTANASTYDRRGVDVIGAGDVGQVVEDNPCVIVRNSRLVPVLLQILRLSNSRNIHKKFLLKEALCVIRLS